MRRLFLSAVLGLLTLGIVGLLPSAAAARSFGRWRYARPSYAVYYYPPAYRVTNAAPDRVPVSAGPARASTPPAPPRVIEIPSVRSAAPYVPPSLSDYRTSDSYQYDRR